MQLNKKEFKKLKRAARKAATQEGDSDNEGGAAAAAGAEGDQYDFSTDFVDIGDD